MKRMGFAMTSKRHPPPTMGLITTWLSCLPVTSDQGTSKTAERDQFFVCLCCIPSSSAQKLHPCCFGLDRVARGETGVSCVLVLFANVQRQKRVLNPLKEEPKSYDSLTLLAKHSGLHLIIMCKAQEVIN